MTKIYSFFFCKIRCNRNLVTNKPPYFFKKIFWTVKFTFTTESAEHVFTKFQFDDNEITLSDIAEYLYDNKEEIDQVQLLSIVKNKERFNTMYTIEQIKSLSKVFS